jgi:NAD(P)-dependent dehydrogenase (short-subunit alcohol dehydrogenase family)
MYLKSAVGAASGIGREIARTYCREGAKVVIADLTQAGAAAAAAELGDADSAIGVGMDVTDDTQMDTMWQQPSLPFGGIDILVSNAGIQTVGPLDQFEFDKWKQLLSIHLDGAFLTTRAAPRQMYRQGTGGSIIIYMGSVQSKGCRRWRIHYIDGCHGSESVPCIFLGQTRYRPFPGLQKPTAAVAVSCAPTPFVTLPNSPSLKPRFSRAAISAFTEASSRSRA